MTIDDLEKQIDELQTQLRLLRAKHKQLKHPHSLTMTIDEAAALLGINRATAYKAAQNGQIPSIRVGKQYRIPIAAMNRLLGDKERTKIDPPD